MPREEKKKRLLPDRQLAKSSPGERKKKGDEEQPISVCLCSAGTGTYSRDGGRREREKQK